VSRTRGGTDERSAIRVPSAARLAVVEEGFVRQWHPYRWELRDTTRQWASQQGLLPGDVESAYADDLLRYTDLIAGYYVGESVPVVQAIADFSTWFFVWDDWHAVAARRRQDQAWYQLSAALRAALRDPRSHRTHPTPPVAGLADIFARLFTLLGPTWNARLAGQEFSSRYNDLCSMLKEIAAGEVHNLGVSLMRHEGLDFDQAQAEVRAYVADRVQRFLDIGSTTGSPRQPTIVGKRETLSGSGKTRDRQDDFPSMGQILEKRRSASTVGY
jgi:hypothetical protein